MYVIVKLINWKKNTFAYTVIRIIKAKKRIIQNIVRLFHSSAKHHNHDMYLHLPIRATQSLTWLCLRKSVMPTFRIPNRSALSELQRKEPMYYWN
jgi:hypothetical protein